MPEIASPVSSHSFKNTLATHGVELRRASTEILQINVGKLCNLTCVHCHVNAGPNRKEIITKDTIDRIVDWLVKTSIHTVDLTGGTPEMIPDYRYLIARLKALTPKRHIMNRCNVTIMHEPGYEWVGAFLAENEIEIVASMPCYQPKNVNAQRGDGVFDKSISALQQLNALGYGKERPELPLHLVYNPNGAFLPPDQAELENDYKVEMKKHFGITFNKLYALANLPVSRFASYLKRNGEYQSYLNLLVENFNPSTVDGLMCRNTLSVSWQGDVYDCDFNQMLKMQLEADGQKLKVWDLDAEHLENRSIQTANHCFGCTAGAGSSCGGSVL